MMKILRSIIFASILLGFTISGNSQVVMNGPGTYFQNFDGLGTLTQVWANNSTIPNWWAQRSGTGTNITASTGTGTAGDLYNFGLASGPDRAIGSIGSGNATAGDFAWGIQFQNNSATPVADIIVAYAGEQWRKSGTTAPQTVGFYYMVSPTIISSLDPDNNVAWTPFTALDFISPIYSATASALVGDTSPNRTIIGAITISGINIPPGYFIMLKWDDPDHSGTDHGLSIDSVTVSWTVSSHSINTGNIAGSPFCVTATSGAAVDVPYAIGGTFNPGNEFKAYLSDETGSFITETEIGSILSVSDDTIPSIIPAGMLTGTFYRIRVKSTDTAIIGSDNGTDITINLGPADVSAVIAVEGISLVDIDWTNPLSCYDEVLVVAKPTASIATNPTGDGSAYTANSTNFTDPLNTIFDGSGAVVYKSSSTGPITVSGLTNWTDYYFKIWTRKGSDWSSGVEVSAMPKDVPDIAITEIMYNTGGGINDSLEFIELYNNESFDVVMTGFTFSQGVSHTFAADTILANSYLVIAKDSVDFQSFYGMPALQWGSGSLSNTGDFIVLLDAISHVIDSVNYAVTAPWPDNALMKSIRICNPSLDNNDGNNWSYASEFVDTLTVNDSVWANPGGGCVFPPDLIPPLVLDAYATSLGNVVVVFSEPIDNASGTIQSNYTFLNAGTSLVSLGLTADTAFLTLGVQLSPGITDTISIDSIQDLSFNYMTDLQKFPIVFGSAPVLIDTIVYWTFPNNPDDSIAEGGLPVNLGAVILRESSYPGAYTFNTAGATTSCASSVGWDGGNDTKYWWIVFNTVGYDSLRFYSKQKSSGTGPRDFKVQASYDGWLWFDVPGAGITVGNNWSGQLSNINIPTYCNNNPNAYLRWIMTSDSAVTAGLLAGSLGTSRMDDLLVTGRLNPLVGFNNDEEHGSEITIFPNPGNGVYHVVLPQEGIFDIRIFSVIGTLIYQSSEVSIEAQIDVTEQKSGIYIMNIVNTLTGKSVSRKLILE